MNRRTQIVHMCLLLILSPWMLCVPCSESYHFLMNAAWELKWTDTLSSNICLPSCPVCLLPPSLQAFLVVQWDPSLPSHLSGLLVLLKQYHITLHQWIPPFLIVCFLFPASIIKLQWELHMLDNVSHSVCILKLLFIIYVQGQGSPYHLEGSGCGYVTH